MSSDCHQVKLHVICTELQIAQLFKSSSGTCMFENTPVYEKASTEAPKFQRPTLQRDLLNINVFHSLCILSRKT